MPAIIANPDPSTETMSHNVPDQNIDFASLLAGFNVLDVDGSLLFSDADWHGNDSPSLDLDPNLPSLDFRCCAKCRG